MSTWWYFECLDHAPALRSDSEFSQHTGDIHYALALTLMTQRPLDPEVEVHTPRPGASNREIVEAYFARHAVTFLKQHPTCRIGLINEYDERVDEAGVAAQLTDIAAKIITARASMHAAELAGIIGRFPMVYNNEAELQAEIAAALADAEVEARREVVLSDGSSRIDLLAGRVGIEVKVAGARDAVDRQLARYAKCEEISALVLVTTRAGHGVGRYELEGVPVFVCSLIGAGL